LRAFFGGQNIVKSTENGAEEIGPGLPAQAGGFGALGGGFIPDG